MTQSQKVLNYLKKNGRATTNELRNTFHIVDVPKAVSILNKRGYQITSSRNNDGTATYQYGEKQTSLSNKRIYIENGIAYIIDL